MMFVVVLVVGVRKLGSFRFLKLKKQDLEEQQSW
jgi:hypothetical protein